MLTPFYLHEVDDILPYAICVYICLLFSFSFLNGRVYIISKTHLRDVVYYFMEIAFKEIYIFLSLLTETFVHSQLIKLCMYVIYLQLHRKKVITELVWMRKANLSLVVRYIQRVHLKTFKNNSNINVFLC